MSKLIKFETRIFLHPAHDDVFVYCTGHIAPGIEGKYYGEDMHPPEPDEVHDYKIYDAETGEELEALPHGELEDLLFDSILEHAEKHEESF